ncbi:MAG: hypothetical protein ACO1N2_01865 [Candidatus Saccharimonadota bacterium]
MIDYILDNMAVNGIEDFKTMQRLKKKSLIESTICDEIAHEQRRSPEHHRKTIKSESLGLDSIDDFTLLSSIANELIEHGVLDLDEGSGDVMVAYEASTSRPLNLLVEKRVVVTDDRGVMEYCGRHGIEHIHTEDYRVVLLSLAESDGR